MSSYADRKNELKSILFQLQKNKSTIFIKAGKAVGITSFLKNCLCPKLKEHEGKNVFYINASNNLDFITGMMHEIIKDDQMYQIMQDCLNNNFGGKDNSIVFQDIPYIGNTLSLLLSQKTSVPLYTGNFNSAIEELLTVFFKRLNKKCIVVIDSTQLVSEDTYQIITDLIEYNDVQFVFAFTDDSINYLKLKNLICLKDFTFFEIPFAPPDTFLVRELGEILNKRITEKKASALLQETSQNIHEIISFLQNTKTLYELDSIDKIIIFLLKTITFPIQKELLLEIIKTCPIFSLDINSSFNNSIHSLELNRVIYINNDKVELSSLNHPSIVDNTSSYAESLYYKQIVLSFFKKHNNFILDNNYITLLYNIANELQDQVCSKYARMLIKINLINGFYIERSVLDNANLKDDSENDCIVASIVFARKRLYSTALEWLKKIKTNYELSVKAFYGILLNRTRNHTEADIVLRSVLHETQSKEMKVIVGSFLISNLIHQENIEQAQKEYYLLLHNCSDATNIGYLIRNSVSAFPNEISMYDTALNEFLTSSDMFGYYTTLSNKGSSMFNTDVKTSIELLTKAETYLKKYGENITHIVKNNLGLAYIFSNELDKAASCFSIVSYTEKSEMPKLFAQINLACCSIIAGKTEFGLSLIKSIERDVEEHPLDRVRQKYYINRLFIEYFSNQPLSNELIQKAQKHLDRYYPQKTLAAISFYKKNIKTKNRIMNSDWISLFSPCKLSYWFIDPLKVFPKGFINQFITM